MSALRPESSTVSLPPRERYAAKRKEKARRQGQAPPAPPGPPGPPGPPIGPEQNMEPNQQPPKPLALTLAGQRQRRANEVAYISKRDGIHIKRVVRRPLAPEPALTVPYLPGQEDIPRSDEESDSTNSTILEPEILIDPAVPGLPSANWDGLDLDISMMGIETGVEPVETDDDLVDYDADGEDENTMNDDCFMHPFLAGRSETDSNFWRTTYANANGTACQPIVSSHSAPNLLADATNEDMVLLLGGLDDLNFIGTGSNSPFDFASSSMAIQGHSADSEGTVGLATQNLAPPIANALLSHSHNRPGPSLADPQTQPQFDLASTLRHPLNPDGTAISRPTSRNFDLHAVTPARQRSIDSMPPPRLPQAQTQGPAAPPIAPLPRLSRRDTPHPFTPRAQTPAALPSRPPTSASTRVHSRLSTRELVAQARAQVRATAPFNAISCQWHADPGDEEDDTVVTLEPTPLRVSLSLPSFLSNPPDPNEHRPQTPIRFEDTDIGLNADSPVQITQPQTIAREFGNVNILFDNTIDFFERQPPTLLELKTNALKQLRLSSRKHRGRRAARLPDLPTDTHLLIPTGNLTSEQRKVLAPMEYYILKEVVCTNPWPNDRETWLLAAVDYAVDMTKISDPEVYTPRFQDTVYSKTSANRGSSLTRVEFLVEHTFGLLRREKEKIMALLRNDQFLFPTTDRDSGQYFCVSLIGDVLEIIFFKSGKLIGLVFMEELCNPDNPVKCANWHKKLYDRTATRGIPPAAIAFAAAQIYWALEKMYLGTALHFSEQQFRVVWDRYFRAVVKLPHLKQLRLALLDRFKLYYMDHWPAEERDEDDNSYTAW